MTWLHDIKRVIFFFFFFTKRHPSLNNKIDSSKQRFNQFIFFPKAKLCIGFCFVCHNCLKYGLYLKIFVEYLDEYCQYDLIRQRTALQEDWFVPSSALALKQSLSENSDLVTRWLGCRIVRSFQIMVQCLCSHLYGRMCAAAIV